MKTFLRPLVRSFSQAQSHSLKGHSFCLAEELTPQQVKGILHTGIELQSLASHNKLNPSTISPETNAILLLRNPCTKLQASFAGAAHVLGVRDQIIVDPSWDTVPHPQEYSSYLKDYCDVLFCEARILSRAREICIDSPIPVLFVKSCIYLTVQTLGQLMAVYQRFGRLQGLTVGWIGPPCQQLNSYLALCPKVGINVKFSCGYSASLPVTPSILKNVELKCSKEGIPFTYEECNMNSLQDTLKDVDIIATTRHQCDSLTVTDKIARLAHSEYALLHALPRGEKEISSELFRERGQLIWEGIRNMKWIFAAFILRLLKDYQHVTDFPKF